MVDPFDDEKNRELIKNELLEINKKLLDSLDNYRKTLSYMCADAPIGCLCLPKVVESILNDNGIVRIYDLFNADLAKIESLTAAHRLRLASSLDQFITMS